MANLGNSSGTRAASRRAGSRAVAHHPGGRRAEGGVASGRAGAAAVEGTAAVEDDEDSRDLEIDEIQIDEASLPQLDVEDPEAVLAEQEHADLLDRRWLERPVDDADDEEHSALDQLGFTIELNATGAEDDAQVVDLDIGELLEPLPDAEPDGDVSLARERTDGAFGMAALRDMLLPESEEQHDEREVGDDDRFPVFDDGAPAWRPVQGDDDAPEGEPS